MHIADLQELLVLPDQAHGIQLLTTDPEAVADYAVRVSDAVGSEERAVEPWWVVSPQAAQIMDTRDAGMVIVLGIVFIMAAFGIVNTMLMSVFERTRELGVLKAIGLRPGRMVLLIVFESLYLATVAGLIGLVLGGLLDWWAVAVGLDYSDTNGEGMQFAGMTLDPHLKGEINASGIIIPFVAMFVVSFLASLWPAIRAARLRPVEAIRTE
jgi:ABC-type lipoprotein release transport system permease subunit